MATAAPDKSGNYNETAAPDKSGNYNERNDAINAVAILVAGGFHMPGITKILRQKGIPYVLVTPKITKLDDSGASYLTHFIRELVRFRLLS